MSSMGSRVSMGIFLIAKKLGQSTSSICESKKSNRTKMKMKSDLSSSIFTFIICSLTFHGSMVVNANDNGMYSVLSKLYHNTNGDLWSYKWNWMNESVDICSSWYGIGCNSGNIAIIDLEDNNLKGSLPEQLATFTNLTYLTLSSNLLSRSIPSQFGELTNLIAFDIDSNNISGTFPSQIGMSTSLLEFQFEYNSLTGMVPSEIGLLTLLQFFIGHYNQFQGTLPSELGNLNGLFELRLGYNQIDGSIPSQLGKLTIMEALGLNDNSLTGSLPSQFGLLNASEVMWVYENDLSGSLPSELGQMTFMLEFLAYNNEFVNSVPSEIGLMSAMLYAFDVSTNMFTGTIPSQLGQMSLLEDEFYLDTNAFEGTVPSELGQLTEIVVSCEEGYAAFTLFSNSLCGDIPSQLGDMSAAYLSGGANYWATFVGNNNQLGTSCIAPTSMPIVSPTSDNDDDDDSSSKGIFDEVEIAAIGSLLFIAVLGTCFVSRKFYVYLKPARNPEAEAEWANNNPMMRNNRGSQQSSDDSNSSRLSLGSMTGLSTGSNPALGEYSSHSKPGAAYIGITSTGMAVPGAASNASAMVIPFERLNLDRKPFAAGASGSIFKGSYNGVSIAAKMLFSYTGDKERHEFDREFRMLSTMRHPNIVALYGMAHDPKTDQLYIIQEFVGGGNLHDLSRRDDDTFSMDMFVSITLELFGALQYMHDAGVAHRDMKPQNLLVTTTGSLRVCDLGLARNYQQSSITANVGTALYMPPEAYDDNATSADTYVASKWDMYSTGMILYELWYKSHPWERLQAMQIFGKIAREERPSFPPNTKGIEIPSELKDLICELWLNDPSARPVASVASTRFTQNVVPKLLNSDNQQLEEVPLETPTIEPLEELTGTDV